VGSGPLLPRLGGLTREATKQQKDEFAALSAQVEAAGPARIPNFYSLKEYIALNFGRSFNSAGYCALINMAEKDHMFLAHLRSCISSYGDGLKEEIKRREAAEANAQKAAIAAQEQRIAREEAAIRSEAARRVAALKKQAEDQLKEEQKEEKIRAAMAELLATPAGVDARVTARAAELSGLF
jgi:hypothetical protein